jgi:hypothetical protein
MLTLLPAVAQASLASDMADFKIKHRDIYSRITPTMAMQMDQLVQDVYNDTMASYNKTEPSFDQVNKHAARRLVRDPKYDGLLDYIAAQIEDPRNSDVRTQYESLLDEICTIVARAVDAAQNVQPGGPATTVPGINPPAGKPPFMPLTPDNAVAISATPAQLEEIKGHWANAELQQLITLGVIRGDEQGLINADAEITRAEFAAMLVRVLRLGNIPILQGRFVDVPTDRWHFFAVNQAAEAGIVAGYQPGLFGPDDPITREQMTVMIVKALQREGKLDRGGYEQASILAPFLDRQDISGWASASVSLSVEFGLIEGRDGERFDPRAHTSRAEAGVVILRMLKHMSQGNTAEASAA